MERDTLLDSEAFRAKVIEDIRESTESKERKDEHRKRAEVYSDRTNEYVLRKLELEFSKKTALEIAHRTPNLSLTRKVVGKKARVYKDRPTRTAEGRLQEYVDNFVDLVGLDAFMKKVNRGVELHKNVLVKVLPYPVDEGGYSIGLTMYRPHEYDVITHPDRPEEVLAVVLSYTEDQNSFLQDYRTADEVDQVIAANRAAEGEKEEERFVWWSKSRHFVTNEKGEVVRGPEGLLNPFGVMPFLSIAKDQHAAYWVDGGEGLADNAILINLLLADLNFAFKYQGTGVGYIFGEDIPDTVEIGPNKFFKVKYQEGQPTPQIGFASPNPNLADGLRLIETQLAFFLTSEDLEPGAISGTLSAGNAASGIQEVIQKAEPVTAIEDEQQLYKDKEPAILRVAAAMVERLKSSNELSAEWAEMAGVPLDIDYDLMFQPPKPFQTEKERIELAKAKKELGLYTDMDLLRDLFPDLDDKGLEKKLVQLREEKAAKAPALMQEEDEPKDQEEPPAQS